MRINEIFNIRQSSAELVQHETAERKACKWGPRMTSDGIWLWTDETCFGVCFVPSPAQLSRATNDDYTRVSWKLSSDPQPFPTGKLMRKLYFTTSDVHLIYCPTNSPIITQPIQTVSRIPDTVHKHMHRRKHVTLIYHPQELRPGQLFFVLSARTRARSQKFGSEIKENDEKIKNSQVHLLHIALRFYQRMQARKT